MLLNPVQTRSLFLHALENHYAILAVNADSPAAITDVLEAARTANAPIVVETSLWQLTGRSFGDGDAILGLARYLVQVAVLSESDRFANVPIVFHTDHIKGPATVDILSAAIRGVSGQFASSISLDSSSMSEAENLQTASKISVVAKAASRSLTLEMEAGVDDGLTPLDVTDRLVGGIDSAHPGILALWAPGCGTRHGFSADGFPAFSSEHVAAQQKRASELTGRPIGIALHGSSGLPEPELQAAVAAGVVKVNWSTESLLFRSQAAREYYATEGFRLEPGAQGFKDAAMDNGVQQFVGSRYVPVVAERIGVLGGTGMAPKYLATSLP